MDPNASELHVLYEDNHLIAVHKPAGMLTQGDSSGETCLMDVVKSWLAAKYHKPGQVFLGLTHRLDRPVSGVVLFAKTSKGASRISQQFRERAIGKTYRARLEGVIEPPRGQLVHFIAQRDDAVRVSVSEHATPGSKRASLHYVRCSAGRDECVVEIELETGRKHQIRAQFAHLGHPIRGDRLYGARDVRPDKTIALSAIQLRFQHPITKAPVVVALPPELASL